MDYVHFGGSRTRKRERLCAVSLAKRFVWAADLSKQFAGDATRGHRNDCGGQMAAQCDLFTAFGPETPDADKHAGALSLTDARILAFPVRSLRGVFAWVTCKAVLERLNRDINLAGQMALGLNFNVGKEEAVCPDKCPLLLDGGKLVFEEFEFTQSAQSGLVAEWVGSQTVTDKATQDRIKSHLVVLHDDDFTHFVRHATEIVARIGLDYERKTVKDRALFYQECLPAETLFYSVVFANASRREGDRRNASEILKYLRDSIPSVLQIGGDETTGKGICAIRFIEGKAGGQ